MTQQPVDGITIEERNERVIIDATGGHWEGSAADAERLLTRMHYALARTRPGTTIVSMLVNGRLWGAKVVDEEPLSALTDARGMLEQLLELVSRLEEEQAGTEPDES